MAHRRSRGIAMATGPVAAGRIPEEDAPQFPYEDLGDLEKEAIEDALRLAWARLPAAAQRQGIPLEQVGETPITRLLRDELDKIRRDESRPIPDFSDDTFEHIPENENVPDFTGRPFDENQKQPDLVFRPRFVPRYVARVSTYGLFVECKIIHKSEDHLGPGNYCESGLLRFVDGRYAWTMPSGLMVAYVRNGKDLITCLVPHLDRAKHRETYHVKALPALRVGTSERTPAVYVSTHARPTVKVGERSSGDIEIAHLWLQVGS